jgi:hypothetical protein
MTRYDLLSSPTAAAYLLLYENCVMSMSAKQQITNQCGSINYNRRARVSTVIVSLKVMNRLVATARTDVSTVTELRDLGIRSVGIAYTTSHHFDGGTLVMQEPFKTEEQTAKVPICIEQSVCDETTYRRKQTACVTLHRRQP